MLVSSPTETIHQDLHKVAEHSEEFKVFFRDKLALKARQYDLKKY